MGRGRIAKRAGPDSWPNWRAACGACRAARWRTALPSPRRHTPQLSPAGGPSGPPARTHSSHILPTGQRLGGVLRHISRGTCASRGDLPGFLTPCAGYVGGTGASRQHRSQGLAPEPVAGTGARGQQEGPERRESRAAGPAGPRLPAGVPGHRPSDRRHERQPTGPPAGRGGGRTGLPLPSRSRNSGAGGLSRIRGRITLTLSRLVSAYPARPSQRLLNQPLS
ncbi:MAG: hypothetical protein JWL68_6018 [Actinomycetia bacterium]|nr:hypothetical protein [Actinomycetes bacterium]